MSRTTLVLAPREIRELLPITVCIDLMHSAMIAVSRGDAVLPIRSAMVMPGDIGMQGAMAGYLAPAGLFANKLISLFPRNAGTGHSSHLGLLALFETEHGYPVGLFDASEVTAIRTAAASGLATRLLARTNARRLAILGTGEQARRHIAAMIAVRPIEDVVVWGRDPAKAAAMISDLSLSDAIAVRVARDVREAVLDADIVCTTTHASEPILTSEWVAPGTHVNVVGSSVPSAAEVDGPLVARSRLFVDYRPYTEALGGEYRRALEAGLIGADHILAEIGEVAAQRQPGRRNDAEVTLYKSLGNIAQDIAAGRFLIDAARHRGVGQSITLS